MSVIHFCKLHCTPRGGKYFKESCPECLKDALQAAQSEIAELKQALSGRTVSCSNCIAMGKEIAEKDKYIAVAEESHLDAIRFAKDKIADLEKRLADATNDFKIECEIGINLQRRAEAAETDRDRLRSVLNKCSEAITKACCDEDGLDGGEGSDLLIEIEMALSPARKDGGA